MSYPLSLHERMLYRQLTVCAFTSTSGSTFKTWRGGVYIDHQYRCIVRMQPPTVGTEQLVTLALAIDEREGVRVCRACMRVGKHPYIIVRGAGGEVRPGPQQHGVEERGS